jgi:hypothetical protein
LHAPTVSQAAETIDGTSGIFCGYCREPARCFQGDPKETCGGDGIVAQCNATNAICATAPYTSCQQFSPGAFGDPLARRIDVDASVGANLGDFAAHGATFASISCVPPTFQVNCLAPPCPPNDTTNLDSLGSFPGPAALSLQGRLRLLRSALGTPPAGP